MAPDLGGGLLKPALIVLGAAAVVIPLFHRLRVSPVVGFMLVGIDGRAVWAGRLAESLPAIGAITIARPETIAPIGEWGISVLMFMIGLELSLERLRVMRRLVFGLGSLQFALAALAVTVVASRWARGPLPPLWPASRCRCRPPPSWCRCCPTKGG